MEPLVQWQVGDKMSILQTLVETKFLRTDRTISCQDLTSIGWTKQTGKGELGRLIVMIN